VVPFEDGQVRVFVLFSFCFGRDIYVIYTSLVLRLFFFGGGCFVCLFVFPIYVESIS
jgi:hypothetical protein